MQQAVLWKNPISPPATRDEVEQIEKELGFKFPQDFLICAMKNHGANTSQFRVVCLDVPRSLDFLLSLRIGTEIFTPLQAIEKSISLLPGLVPFATASDEGWWCFDYRKAPDNPSIAFWDRALSHNPLKAVIPVARSFTEMCELMHCYEGEALN